MAKFTFIDPEGNGQKFRDNVLEEFKKDNSTITVDCEAKKVEWLSKNKDKDVGSLAMWLSRKEAAWYLFQYVTVRFGASAAYSAPFIRKATRDPASTATGTAMYRADARTGLRAGSALRNTRHATARTNTTPSVRHAEDPTACQTVDVRPILGDRDRLVALQEALKLLRHASRVAQDSAAKRSEEERSAVELD
ncbi:hypothetical protein LTR66_004717 [Elasticomyces elasticus]|nr:hypothetical protein LTR66_004717 [Elasticomyces elasticus]